jgi:hypothetical protein
MISLSIDKLRKSHRPTQEQLNIAEELILSLDLNHKDSSGKSHELFSPNNTFNPVTQYFVQTLQEAILHPGI